MILKILSDKLKKLQLELYIMHHLKDFKTEVGLEVVGCDIMSVYDKDQEYFKLSITYNSLVEHDGKIVNNFCTQQFLIDYKLKIKGLTFKKLQEVLDEYWKTI